MVGDVAEACTSPSASDTFSAAPSQEALEQFPPFRPNRPLTADLSAWAARAGPPARFWRGSASPASMVPTLHLTPFFVLLCLRFKLLPHL
jgi:hypothetical protein